MNISIDEIRKIVRETISGIEESDLITKNTTKSWEEYKKEFKELSTGLLSNIEGDDYSDAEKGINKTIDMLKNWKKKIDKGSDSVIDEN